MRWAMTQNDLVVALRRAPNDWSNGRWLSGGERQRVMIGAGAGECTGAGARRGQPPTWDVIEMQVLAGVQALGAGSAPDPADLPPRGADAGPGRR